MNYAKMKTAARRTATSAGAILRAARYLTVFHVAPGGNDANAGTEAAPWATVAKVNATTFHPGDKILFQRGGEWHDQLLASTDGAAGAPITYGDYGDGKKTKPTFDGSDVIMPELTRVDGSVYSFPIAACPGGRVYWVYVNHVPLLAATKGDETMPANSFFIGAEKVIINTKGVDPAKAVITVGVRATGQNADQGVIASNGHSNLVFTNLIGRETAQVPDGGVLAHGVIDAYVIRVQGGSNVRLDHCEAHYGGKHNVGAINTTGFIASGVIADGGVNGVEGNTMPYGNATALVAYADGNFHHTTQQWIDCVVRNYFGDQPAFITHNDGADSIDSLLIQNLQSFGSPVALLAGQNVAITYRGGLIKDSNLTAYTAAGTTEMIDGVTVTGSGADILICGKTTAQNCLLSGSAQDGGIQSSGPDNIVRFNTIVMQGGTGIHLQKDASSTKVYGNLISGAPNTIKIDGGATGCTADYDFFDGAADRLAPLKAAGLEAHGKSGAAHFTNPKTGDYSLRAASPAINLVPKSEAGNITADIRGKKRPAGAGFDAGAYEAP